MVGMIISSPEKIMSVTLIPSDILGEKLGIIFLSVPCCIKLFDLAPGN